jgi:Flp pilus assembly protein TadD
MDTASIRVSDPGLMEKASLLHRLGRGSEAVTFLQAAERMDPTNPALLLNLGVALVDAGRGYEAVAVLRRLTELRPGNPLVDDTTYFVGARAILAYPNAERSTAQRCLRRGY